MLERLAAAMKKHPVVSFFILAFAFTWAHWVPQALVSRGVSAVRAPDFMVIVAGYGPALAALIVTASLYGRPGLRALAGRLFHWRVGVQWYAFALLAPPCIAAAGLGLHLLLGGAAPPFAQAGGELPTPGGSLWLEAGLLFLIFTLGFDGLGEELGWRGFALPHLQAAQSALVASLVLGIFWGAWHIPYALTDGSALASRPIPLLIVDVVASAILFTWLFNHTGGSVLLAILFHASGNTTHNLLPSVWHLLALDQSDPGVASSSATELRIFLFQMAIRWLLAIVVVLVAGRAFSRRPSTPSTLVAEPSA
jgi:membrane protease YdiL (CAAX protease family)